MPWDTRTPEDQCLVGSSEANEAPKRCGPLVWVLLASNLLLLSLVLWMATLAAPGVTSEQGRVQPRETWLRELYDVNYFDGSENASYSRFPKQAKIVTTECVIDTVQATAYLGTAAVQIYRAEICPNPVPLGCTAPVAHTITSFAWVAAFLTSAASTCAKSLRPSASCTAAILRDLATAGSTIYGFDEDCYLTNPRKFSFRVFQRWWKDKPFEERRLRSEAKDVKDANVSAYRAKSKEIAARLRNLTAEHGRAVLPNVLLDAETAGFPRDLLKLQTVKAIDRKHKYKTERNFALASCVFDSVQATTWIMRALLSIESASRSCPDPRECAIDILYASCRKMSEVQCYWLKRQLQTIAFLARIKSIRSMEMPSKQIVEIMKGTALFIRAACESQVGCKQDNQVACPRIVFYRHRSMI
eukprot:Skav202462  [mRNA]  locus=scaffold149:362656:364617:+ [translate_table: standard]